MKKIKHKNSFESIAVRLVFLCIFFCSFRAISQQFNIDRYNVIDGLGQSTIFTVCEDKRGLIWLGTDGGGISIFDGKNFKNLTQKDGLKNDFITRIIESSDGNIWFTNYNEGISQFDGINIKNYNEENGLALNNVIDIYEGNDSIIPIVN